MPRLVRMTVRLRMFGFWARHNRRRDSELVEEREKSVVRLVAGGVGVRRCGPGDGLLLECHVRVQVDASGGWAFVAEPQRDDGEPPRVCWRLSTLRR